MRVAVSVVAAVVALFAFPGSALASTGTSQGTIPALLPLSVSLVGLLVAVLLLVEVWQLRKISMGGAIGENIRYVILATICLAGASIADWALNFVTTGFTSEQIAFARMVLVVVAMSLLAVYFLSVRRVFTGYLKAMTEMEQVSSSVAATDAPSSEKDVERG